MNGQDQRSGGPPGYPPPPGGQPPGSPHQPGYPGQPGSPAGPPRGSGPGFCPACGSGEHQPASFTWWGGLLGPKLLNHVTCSGCGTSFNAKTGKSNNVAIGIYLACAAVLTILVFWYLIPGLL